MLRVPGQIHFEHFHRSLLFWQPMVVGRREATHLLTSSFLWRGEQASKPAEAPERAIVRPGRLDFRGLPRLLHAGLGRR